MSGLDAEDKCLDIAAVLDAALDVLCGILMRTAAAHSRPLKDMEIYRDHVEFPSLEMDSLPPKGTRVSLSGSIGTIRYTGSVNNTTGLWLGIEWDDAQRGKHDGVKDGKRYFDCR